MKKFSFVLSAFILLTGCQILGKIYTNYDEIIVDAKVDSDININQYNKCYVITDKNLKSLDGKNYFGQIKKSMQKDGFIFVSSKQQANCLLYVDYGVNQKKQSFNLPVFESGDVASAETEYNVFTNKMETTYNRDRQFAGYQLITKVIDENFLTITARKKDNEDLWYTNIKIPHETLDFMFPILVELSKHFRGKKYYNTDYAVNNYYVNKVKTGCFNEIDYSKID